MLGGSQSLDQWYTVMHITKMYIFTIRLPIELADADRIDPFSKGWVLEKEYLSWRGLPLTTNKKKERTVYALRTRQGNTSKAYARSALSKINSPTWITHQASLKKNPLNKFLHNKGNIITTNKIYQTLKIVQVFMMMMSGADPEATLPKTIQTSTP